MSSRNNVERHRGGKPWIYVNYLLVFITKQGL